MITGMPLSARLIAMQMMTGNLYNTYDTDHNTVRLFSDTTGALDTYIVADPTRIESQGGYPSALIEIPTQYEIQATDYTPLEVGKYKFGVGIFPPNDRFAVTNTSEIVFPVATTDWGQITHACLGTKWFGKPGWASSDFTVIFYVKFDVPKTIYTGDRLIIPENSMKLYSTSRVV